MAKKKKANTKNNDPAAVTAAAEKRAPKLGRVALERDPRVYATTIKPVDLPQKRLVGLDLGTNCGVAFVDFLPGVPVNGAVITMGMWNLSVGDYDTGPLRHVRLRQFLSVLNPDLIMLEDVKYAGTSELFMKGASTTAIIARAAKPIEFLGGLKTTVTCWAEERRIPVHCVGISAIKNFATGRGNANKSDMIKAANEQFGTTFDPETYEQTGVDNICDAAFICKMGLQAYSEGL